MLSKYIEGMENYMSEKMKYPWMENVRQVEPYIPGEQPKFADMVKLNTNENPYPPAPEVEKCIKEMNSADFRRYPDPTAGELVRAIAEQYKVSEKEVFVGVGSDDVLGMAFMTFFNGKKEILFPDITYSFYEVWADMLRIPYRTIPLDDSFRIAEEDYFCENGGIVIANPNAPTGIAEPENKIVEIVKKNQKTVVIIDEAYVDFGGTSMLKHIHEYDNLLVVMTYSKSRSMAGMRIGFAIGNEALIQAMYNVRNSYNSYTMNLPSIVCGTAAVRNTAYYAMTTAKITATRERVVKELEELGFIVLPSAANFVFASHKNRSAESIFEELKKHHIYVRHFKKPRIDNFLRISIGTDEEMDKLIKTLKAVI